MPRKWFGETGENWSVPCKLYLHATGQDYSRATGVPANSPGHSTIRSENGRVLERRMDLHCDDANLLIAVLPHNPPGLYPIEPLLEFDQSEHPIRMAVITEPIVQRGGWVDIPDRPGLGIDLDEAALREFAVQ